MARRKIARKEDIDTSMDSANRSVDDIDAEIERLKNKINKRKEYLELKRQERIYDIMNGETVKLRYVGGRDGRSQTYRKVYKLYDPNTCEELAHPGELIMPMDTDVEVRKDVAETILKNMNDHIEMKKRTEDKTIIPWIIQVG